MTSAAAPADHPHHHHTARARRRFARRATLRWFRARHEVMWLFLVALAVRVAAGWLNPSVLNDSVTLLKSAERFRSEGLRAAFDVHDHPLLPWLVSLAPSRYDPEEVATLLCAVAGAFAVWPLHVLARRACGRHAATAGCLVYAALPKAVAVTSVPLTSALLLPLFLSSLSLVVAAGATAHRRRRDVPRLPLWRRKIMLRWQRFFGRTSWRRVFRLASAGLIAGLAYLARPEGVVAASGAVIAAFTLARRGRRWVSATIVALAFVVVAAPYAIELSRHAGHFTLSPKKDVARFVGVAATPALPRETSIAAYDSASALEGALTGPVILLVLIGAFTPTRWRHRRSIQPRLLLLGVFAAFIALVMRLQTGWGYGGARHMLPGAVLLLPFAGEAFIFLGGFIGRMVARRRLAVVLASFFAIPCAVYCVLRPAGEDQDAQRRLGEAIAKRATDHRAVIATFAEPLVAYYAGRSIGTNGVVRDVPLWGRHGAVLDRVEMEGSRAALIETLRKEGAQWLVLDLFRTTKSPMGEVQRPGFSLAERLRDDGVLGVPVVAPGGRIAAFPVK